MPTDEPPEGSSDTAMDELEHEAEIIREDLGALVGELDRRRHRAARPVTALVLGLAGASLGGIVLWRLVRRPRSRLHPFTKALRRVAAHPDRVATSQPRVPRKIVGAALSAAAAVAARHLAERWIARKADAE